VGGSLAVVLEGELWERHPPRLAQLPTQCCVGVDGGCRSPKFLQCLQTEKQQSVITDPPIYH